MFVIHDVRKIIFAETVKESFCLKQPNFSKMVSILQRIFFFFFFVYYFRFIGCNCETKTSALIVFVNVQSEI